MVKFKSRYILLEIIGQTNTNSFNSHKFKSEQLVDKILKETNFLFGDEGFGKLKINFQLKYHNEITNLVIIRVSREYLNIIQTVLFMITNIDSKDVRLKILHVSGTIKKIEERAKQIISFWINNFEKNQLMEEKVNRNK